MGHKNHQSAWCQSTREDDGRDKMCATTGSAGASCGDDVTLHERNQKLSDFSNFSRMRRHLTLGLAPSFDDPTTRDQAKFPHIATCTVAAAAKWTA